MFSVEAAAVLASATPFGVMKCRARHGQDIRKAVTGLKDAGAIGLQMRKDFCESVLTIPKLQGQQL